MSTIEVIRLACYAVNTVVCFSLVVYFAKEYMTKKLRASLAWAVGFLLFGFLIISLATYTTVVEVSKVQVMIAFMFAAAEVSVIYYGASLVFFGEESFFREKITVIFFLAMLFIGSFLTYTTEEGQLVQTMGFWTVWIFLAFYVVIGTMFYWVSRKVPKTDPRRRAIALVAAAWYIVAFWNSYVGLAWGENVAVEAVIFLLGSFGFLLLLYGMTAGKTTRK